MKLPNAVDAIVDDTKLIDYLLATAHPVGGSKADFFRSFGFNESNIDLLRRQIMEVAIREDVEQESENPYGKKYVIDGIIDSPSGRQIKIRTVWIIEINMPNPRLITAHPN